MLVKCPKCDFTQPKDQYCAQCGVDMSTFHVSPPSFFSRLVASKTFIVFIIFVLTLAAGTYIAKNAGSQKAVQRSMELRSNELMTSVEISQPDKDAAESNEAAPTAASDNSAEVSTSSNNINESGSQAPVTKPQVFGSGEAITISNEAKNDEVSNLARFRTLRVFYTQVDTDLLTRLFSEAQSTSQFANFGSYSAGVIPQLGQKLTPSNTKIKILHQIEKRVEERRSASWFVGKENADDVNSNIGFSTSFDLRDFDTQSARGTLLVTRFWKDVTRFPAEIEVNYQSGFFISGLMPHQLPEGASEALTSTPPFQILKDSNFRSRKSEFVIFIEIDSN